MRGPLAELSGDGIWHGESMCPGPRKYDAVVLRFMSDRTRCEWWCDNAGQYAFSYVSCMCHYSRWGISLLSDLIISDAIRFASCRAHQRMIPSDTPVIRQ